MSDPLTRGDDCPANIVGSHSWVGHDADGLFCRAGSEWDVAIVHACRWCGEQRPKLRAMTLEEAKKILASETYPARAPKIDYCVMAPAAMAATDGKPRCTECKRVVHKSVREPGKNYCSWCRKYFPAA